MGGDELTAEQLGIFMADIGQASFTVLATDTAGQSSAAVTIEIKREQLLTVEDQLAFGTVLAGMEVERQLLIRNTASEAELVITDISSDFGSSLILSEQPTSEQPLTIAAGQEITLVATLRLNAEVENPRLTITSNNPMAPQKYLKKKQ